MNKEKKDLLITWSLSCLFVVLHLLVVVALFLIITPPKDTILSKTIDWLIFILVQVIIIYCGYRERLHRKKHIKSERREKCNGEEKQ